MWKKTSILRLLLISACFCLFAPSVGICSANQQYTISATQLEALQNHLNALEQNNETLKMLLTESDEGLTIALEKLTESQKELATLKAQLQQAKNDAESANQSLQTANEELRKAAQSFKQYERERDRTENRLRTQRNIWEVLCLVAVGVAVAR